MKEYIIKALELATNNEDSLFKSIFCGCYYCLEIFKPQEIELWLAEAGGAGGRTALCPNCTIDSVVGDDSGYSITKEILQEMRSHWFSEK